MLVASVVRGIDRELGGGTLSREPAVTAQGFGPAVTLGPAAWRGPMTPFQLDEPSKAAWTGTTAGGASDLPLA
jgi:hypothetical protein